MFFTAEHDSQLFEPDAFQAVASLIDGKRTAEAIVDALGARDVGAMAQSFYAMYELQRRGCVQEFAQRREGVGAREAIVTLRRVVGHGIRIVVTPDYLATRLAEANTVAIRTGKAWCPAKITGKEIWLGPIFVPGRTACWSCLAHRLRVTRPIDAFLAANAQRATVLARPAGVTRTELKSFVQALSRESRDVTGRVATFDLESRTLQLHSVQRRPQCPVCGDDAMYSRQVATLPRPGDRRSARSSAGQSLVSHVSGLTAAIRPTPRRDSIGVHVYDAAPSWASPVSNMTMLKMALSIRGLGTAGTRSRARRTALCEVIERYSGSALGDEPAVRTSLTRLGARAIHPNRSMLFSEAQYRRASEWNARRDATCGVPRPFDPDAVIDWTPLWSLTSGMQQYLPTTLLYHGSQRPGRTMCSSDTNGTAAGETPDDAIVRGFLELVERDAIAIWWYNRVLRPRLALDSIDDATCERLGEGFSRARREAWVLDLTTDLGVPTFAALSRRRDVEPEEILMGFGAHFDPQVASLHAVHEMARQVGMTGASHRGARGAAPLFARWMRSASLAAHPFLGGDGAANRAERLPIPQDRLGACVQIASRANTELLVLDQTRLDIGLPVVRVVAPGLRPAYARLAPGRLYHVPVQMKWRENALSEERLNDFPFFF